MMMRLARALMILVGIIIVQLAAPDAFPLLIATLLVGLVIIQWAAAIFFNRAANADRSILSLQARAQDAVSLAVASSVAAILGLLVVARALDIIPPIDRAVFLVGISFALVMVAAPAVNWLVIWRPWRQA
jgi:hypothetical protein